MPYASFMFAGFLLSTNMENKDLFTLEEEDMLNDLYEFYQQQKERDEFIYALKERETYLKNEICPICGNIGLDALGWDKSICKNCNNEIDK